MAPTESGEWVEPGGDTNDPGFGNFMERVGELAIEGFDNLPSPESLRLFLRIEYLDGDGDELGFVEFLRDDLAESQPVLSEKRKHAHHSAREHGADRTGGTGGRGNIF